MVLYFSIFFDKPPWSTKLQGGVSFFDDLCPFNDFSLAVLRNSTKQNDHTKRKQL